MIADCGLRIADCGKKAIAEAGLRVKKICDPQSAIRCPLR
jgi:hypothetical protein